MIMFGNICFANILPLLFVRIYWRSGLLRIKCFHFYQMVLFCRIQLSKSATFSNSAKMRVLRKLIQSICCKYLEVATATPSSLLAGCRWPLIIITWRRISTSRSTSTPTSRSTSPSTSPSLQVTFNYHYLEEDFNIKVIWLRPRAQPGTLLFYSSVIRIQYIKSPVS